MIPASRNHGPRATLPAPTPHSTFLHYGDWDSVTENQVKRYRKYLLKNHLLRFVIHSFGAEFTCLYRT